MQGTDHRDDGYDVAIIGGGPAGLNAAIVLARACRRVALFDHGKPRNYAARAVHGFLGWDGIAPFALLERGRQEAESYDVEIQNSEVVSVDRFPRVAANESSQGFKIRAGDCTIIARAVLFATGVIDELPEIHGLRELYGQCVHHCPYCDAWEHRGKRLVALASGASAAKLAISLVPWSKHICCCSNGKQLSSSDLKLLSNHGIEARGEAVVRVIGNNKQGLELLFGHGEPHSCDAIFFGAGQLQHSRLPERLGCEINDEGLIQRDGKQHTCLEGVFVAGDAAGDVQFAIVAAAQGATAAAAIHSYLLEQDIHRPENIGHQQS